jgi:Icc protein
VQKNIKETVNILQITDLHILPESGQKMSGVDTEYTFNQVLEHAHAHHGQADLILVTGDLTQHPCASGYLRIVKELEKYQTRTLCLPGNHDDLALMQQFINTNQVNCDKYILFKYWQIICLNSKKTGSQGGYLVSDELDYLATTLAKHPGLNTLIAVHHHPLPTNSKWMDTMMIKNSAELFSLLQNYPQVKAITCGHIHQELEILKNNQIIFGTPSTCFQFKPNSVQYAVDNSKPGYRLMELHSNGQITSKVHRVPLIA